MRGIILIACRFQVQLFFSRSRRVAIGASVANHVPLPARKRLRTFHRANQSVSHSRLIITRSSFAVTLTAFLNSGLPFTSANQANYLYLRLSWSHVNRANSGATTVANFADLKAIVILHATTVAFKANRVFLGLSLLFSSNDSLFRIRLCFRARVQAAVCPTATA